MADQELGALTAGAALGGTELVLVTQGGNSRRSDINAIKTYVLAGLAPADVTGLVEFIQDEVAAYLLDSGGVTITYNDGANTLTIDGVIEEAPIDGDEYVRKDGAWEISSGGTGITDAPSDGALYARRDAAWEKIPFEIGFSFSGLTQADGGNGEIAIYTFRSDVLFPDDFAGSGLKAMVAATASTVFTLKKNNSTIGTITVAIAGTTGTFVTSGGATAFAPGDYLTIHCPNTPDATLADIGITFQGTRE